MHVKQTAELCQMTSLHCTTSYTCQHDDRQGGAAPAHARVAVGRQPQAPPQLDRHQGGDREPQPRLPLRRLFERTQSAFPSCGGGRLQRPRSKCSHSRLEWEGASRCVQQANFTVFRAAHTTCMCQQWRARSGVTLGAESLKLLLTSLQKHPRICATPHLTSPLFGSALFPH
jgi:hypothetical protein